MTKIIVQHFVENLLKVLKVLKTRTALIMNGLAEFRYVPYGRALKRFQNKGAKPTTDISIKILDNCKEICYNITRKRGKNHEKLLRIHRKQKSKVLPFKH